MSRLIKGRKGDIMEAARDLFLEKGYGETTINDILLRTGLSKGGFYHHFKSKEDVLLTIIDDLVDEVVQDMKLIATAPDTSALNKLKTLISVSYGKKLPHIHLLAALARGKTSQLVLYNYYIRIWERYVAPLVGIVEQGVAEGSMDVEYPEETVRLLYKALAFVHEVEPELISEPMQVTRHFMALEQMILRTLGIASEVELGLVNLEIAEALFN